MNRVSSNVAPRASSSSSDFPAISCSGYEAKAPPGEVHTNARRSTRSGYVTANSCATIPPKLTPTARQRSQPTWSSSAAASAA